MTESNSDQNPFANGEAKTWTKNQWDKYIASEEFVRHYTEEGAVDAAKLVRAIGLPGYVLLMENCPHLVVYKEKIYNADTSEGREVLEQAHKRPIRMEAPDGVYAFLRVKPDAAAPSAVIHVVNWNARPDGEADPFCNVTIRLHERERWGRALRFTYYRPSQPEGLDIKPELHSDYVRVTLPVLETWGVLQIQPAGLTARAARE